MFRRDVNNFADDSQVSSTGISFPIAFRKATLYGAEGKLEVQNWKGFSGIASYSYILGNVWNPVTGGLFLGDNASAAMTQTTGHLPDSQDQRQTIRARVRFQAAPHLWMALGTDYNSGLPFQPDLTPQQYATEFGQVVIDQLNFNRDRISPYLTENTSVGTDVYKRKKRSVKLEADAQNLSNRLEVVHFGGLFSGNAIGPSRQYNFRLVMRYRWPLAASGHPDPASPLKMVLMARRYGQFSLDELRCAVESISGNGFEAASPVNCQVSIESPEVKHS